jgi:ribonuclease D
MLPTFDTLLGAEVGGEALHGYADLKTKILNCKTQKSRISAVV